MPDALHLHLMRGLELWQVLWITGRGIHVVEGMLRNHDTCEHEYGLQPCPECNV